MPLFLHASDLHLDSPLVGLDAYPGAPVDRLRGATRRALENLVQFAIRRRVEFVVLAGDIYDTNPMFESSRFFRERMQRLHDENIRVYIVRGNHDHAGIAPRNLMLPPNVKVFAHDRAESFEAVPGVVIHGRSYPRVDCREDLAATYPVKVAGALNVGVLHTCLDDTGHAPYAPTSAAMLAAHGYEYWALGHVHSPKVLREGASTIVFSGNLQGRHVRETGAKGAMLVEYAGATIERVEHHGLDVVRWHHLQIDAGAIASDAELHERVRAALFDTTAADRDVGRLCAVRVTVHGSRSNADDLVEFLQGEAQAAAGLLWLEKIRVTGAQQLGGRLELEHLQSIAAELSQSPDAHDALEDICQRLRKELRSIDARLPATVECLPPQISRIGEAESQRLFEQALRLIAGELQRART